METKATEALVAWTMLTEPADTAARKIVTALGAEEALARLAEGTITEHGVPEDRAAQWTSRLRRMGNVQIVIEHGIQHGGRMILPETIPALADLGDTAPLLLWIKGDEEALHTDNAMSVTGSRAATGYGEHIASEITGDLVSAGVTLNAGGAYGIDGAVHRTALATGGGTVAWLPGGITRIYPAGHGDLLSRIASSPRSAVVTEIAPGDAPTRWRFLARNRLIAAATPATLIIEANDRSGALHVASTAKDLGRQLGATPGPLTSPQSNGTHRLIREHNATLITSAADALEMLTRTPEHIAN